ncbi:hypothetical protein TPY_3347 [Sulfobacillus acidophilus TPY]|uniref:Uncharacterized protein n=1 Tax=Sulfobacillus acidophilus (strain ATCC 700253 / DSM 10332 / NAL) TaxID=679936 RepID=G8TY99_SULAD|nr:hypothetical protein TPY_3347 [Sulfobacillus acidophilus TPY]AEW05063.1 hypothetical protein Sulac_1566 [Sulfobacillus acidophilus DSM 10332]
MERTKSGWPAVWMEDELRSMNPWRWMWLGVWVWLWPGLAMLFWTVRQAPGGWPGMLLTIFWFLGVLLLRYVGALTYNWWIGPKAGFCWIRSGNDVLYICQRRAIGALTVFAGPWGLWTGAFVNVAGWARVIPHRWAVLLIAGPIGAWLIGWLTIVLYNRLSDIFDVRLAIRWLREPDGEWRVIAFDAERVRALSSLLGFSWTIGGILATVVPFLVALTILAHHIPAGNFGLSVMAFVTLTAMGVGWLFAWAMGWWFYGGSVLYRWWARRGGGLTLDGHSLDVAL